MKFLALATAALVAVAQAVQFTNSEFPIKAGTPFLITWAAASGSVTINLKNGPPNALQTVQVITTGQTGTSFSWTPPATLPSDTYALEIIDGTGVPNYSVQFVFQGSASASVSRSVAPTTASSAATTSAPATTATTSAQTSAQTTSARTSSLSTSTRATTTGATPTNTTVPGAAGRLASPFALLLLTVAAVALFN